MITRVTMTGADDSVQPSDLLKLQFKYPFVEWGILVQDRSFGKRRFPSEMWLQELAHHTPLKLSCHLCGQYVTDFMNGSPTGIIKLQERSDIWNQFRRVQLNTHGFKHDFNPTKLIDLLNTFDGHEFIFQFDNKNTHILDEVQRHASNISILFDLSHGAGVLPTEWPALHPNLRCGYAGGLSDLNVVGQIKKIEEIVLDSEIWIDAETHIRSNHDMQFDLNLVESFLKNSEPFVLI